MEVRWLFLLLAVCRCRWSLVRQFAKKKQGHFWSVVRRFARGTGSGQPLTILLTRWVPRSTNGSPRTEPFSNLGFHLHTCKNLLFSQTLKILSFLYSHICLFVLLTITYDNHVPIKTWHMVFRHKTWHVASRHSFTAGGLAMTAQIDDMWWLCHDGSIVSSHLAIIVGSHPITNWRRRVATVDQWICVYMDCFVWHMAATRDGQ
jgi:hypothetical protein